MKKNIFVYVLGCKGLSNEDIEVARAPYFRRYGRELISK